MKGRQASGADHGYPAPGLWEGDRMSDRHSGRTLRDLTDAASAIWGSTTTPLHDGVLSVLIPLADVARQARIGLEGNEVDRQELAKEYGNIILTTLRFIRDAGLDPEACVRLAEAAQSRYAQRLASAAEH
jgi:hypothetical protein